MKHFLLRCSRAASLVVLAMIASSLLMYFAPGYFSDEREMDAAHATTARRELTALHAEQHSVLPFLAGELGHWSRGDLGTSRHLGEPVYLLLKRAAPFTVKLLIVGLCVGWSLAFFTSIVFGAFRTKRFDVPLALGTALFLALPVGAVAILCLVTNHDEPALVLSAVIAVRDFKILHRVFQTAWSAPHLFHARSNGLRTTRIAFGHVLPLLRRELVSVAAMSVAVALSSAVPIEVIFDRPGVGRLAWEAAMNRDLPVLTGVTALVAGCIALSAVFAEPGTTQEYDTCA